MPAYVSRQGGAGNLPKFNGFYTEFRNNPVCGKRAAGPPTGTENDRNLLIFGGAGGTTAVCFEHNPIGSQTILAPVVAAGGLDLGSQDQTDDDGMQIHMGGEAMGLGVTQIVSRTGPFFADFLDIAVADVSGSDALWFGIREVEAVAASPDDYTDLWALNIKSGALKSEGILGNAATDEDDLGVSWADAATKSLRINVDGSGNISGAYYSTDAAFDANGLRQKQSWTALSGYSAYQFAAAINLMPFMLARQAADVMGVVTIRALEFGAGQGS